MTGDRKRPAFLFGAGASIPAGFPSTQDLTDKILSGDEVVRHTDLTYYLAQQPNALPPYDRFVPAIAEVLRSLKSDIDPFLRQRRGSPANYEDLAYVLGQIADSEYGEIENPTIYPFLKEFAVVVGPTVSELRPHISELGQFVREAESYVKDIVFRMLNKKSAQLEHLDVLLNLISSDPTNKPIIATLNHDNHLESAIRSRLGSLDDGFGENVNGVRYWTGYEEAEAGRNLGFFKLHGSVDWFSFRPDQGEPFYDDRIGALVGGDPWHTKAPDGRSQICLTGRPILVIGTFNKLETYTSPLIADIHHAWRSSLEGSNALVICGYGFGDKGINAQIIDWIYRDRTRHILVISPDLEALIDRARGAIANKWPDWVRDGVLHTIESKIEDVSFDQLADFMRESTVYSRNLK